MMIYHFVYFKLKGNVCQLEASKEMVIDIHCFHQGQIFGTTPASICIFPACGAMFPPHYGASGYAPPPQAGCA